ncbi:MAG: carboxypeptidase regulatory-like domain-containing protein [Candidatus Scalindua sp.]|nr:carboxypeptidase regulatory-like domain-containing protein [Candidatus Scalindua sp.]
MKSKLKFALLMAAGLIFCAGTASIAGDWSEPATVIVQVTAAGSPIGDAEVSIDDQSDTTGHNGNRVFQVGKGHHTVSVTDIHGNSESKEVRVNPGEIVQVTFDLGAAGRPATGGDRQELTFSKN